MSVLSPRIDTARAALVAASLGGVAAIGSLLSQLLGSWSVQRGYEAESIARAIASGHGFSFAGNERWLFAAGDASQYFPTAWVDPLFSYLLAGWLVLLGERAQLGVGLMNVAFFAGCIALAHASGRRVAGALGGVAVVLLLCSEPLFRLGFLGVNNSALASLLVGATACMTLHYFARATTPAAAALGALTGLTALGCPAAVLFAPALAVAVALRGGAPLQARARQAAVLASVAAAVVAPWTLRNAWAFGRFVPVRSGGGQIAWVGTVGLGETLQPGISGTAVAPPWRAATPDEAVIRSLDGESRQALHDFQLAVPGARPPAGYADMNEAERDAWYMAEALRFVREQPRLALQLALEKAKLLTTVHGPLGVALALAAVAGALLGMARAELRALGLLAAAYATPFALIVPYFPRYRLPIEPVLAILAVAAAGRLASLLRPSMTREGVGV